MMSTKLFSLACVGAVVMIHLPIEKLSAQAAPPQSPTAVITSASGAERHLFSHERVLSRIGLGPEQVVTVTLQFSTIVAGKPVTVAPLDGGEASAIDGLEGLLVSEDGTVVFSFRAGRVPGLYRLIVQLKEYDYRLEFYVLDLNHPENNPPRLQIVN